MKTRLTIIVLFLGLFCAEAQDWTWSEDAFPSYARMGISAAVLDDSIFFSGGRIDEVSNYLNIVNIYDVGEEEWYINEPLSPGQWLTEAVSANGMVFFAGGNNFQATNWHFFYEIDVFTKETGEWTVDTLSEPRGFLGAVAQGNKVFFAGGGAETFEIFDVIDIYDTETGLWSIDSLSVPRQWIGAAAAGGKVFFAGGCTTPGGNEVTDVIDIYDINTDDWSIEHLSEPRAMVAAVSYGGKVYFAGGARSNNTSCTVIDIYNVSDESWEEPIFLSSPRIVTALNVKNALIFTGVCDNVVLSNGLYQNRNGIVDIYYPDTDEWDFSVPDLYPPRFFYAYASYDNKAYYAGGWPNSGGATDIVNILKLDTITSQESNDEFQEFSLMIYPNPCSGFANLRFTIYESGFTICDLFEISGVKVKSILNEKKLPGTFEMEIDLRDIPAGVYFCVLKTNKRIQTKKIIKL